MSLNFSKKEVVGGHANGLTEVQIDDTVVLIKTYEEYIPKVSYWTYLHLSNLKQVTVVDVSANKFHSIPICVLRMSNLQWLDISNNKLKDLPEDIDRLDQLQTLLLQKNKLTYLPRALVNMPKLNLLVVSGDDLVEVPTAICESTTGLKFISLKNSPVETIVCEDTEEIIESEREREQVEKEFMKGYIEDLRERGQDAIGHFGHMGTLLAHVDIAVSQNPRSLSTWLLSSHSVPSL
ncbi:leucine-rich repeat-containing protein 2-like protein [Willisornis vidua]|uniref:Leucine-rich repeat-containing protein 2-like protein n=1 Tax=Willisornis vidua TaxID=1566151 RepID=A0ABQ9CKH1_9PASS|nr:leucine-rich repeat-containing protein 2-like protein [Willisornis vidua]